MQGAGLFVCLFVCTCNALLWHRHCTFHRHSHFPFNVSLQQIRFVYLFLFSILTRKTKQKKYVPWATLCDSCEPLLESIKNEQLHASRCLAVFDQPKETFCHVWLPSLFSALPLKAVPADALSFLPRTFDACFILIHKVLVALCWKKTKKLHGWLGERGVGEGRSARSWLDEWPSTQLWPPALLALGNNVKQHRPWMTRLCDAGALNPASLGITPRGCNRMRHEGPWNVFFFFFRHLSKWAWERAVSSAVSQSVYRHGWLIRRARFMVIMKEKIDRELRVADVRPCVSVRVV